MVQLVVAAGWVMLLVLVLLLLPLQGAAAAGSSSSSQHEDEVGLGVRPAPGKVAYGIMVYQRVNKTVAEVQAQFEVRFSIGAGQGFCHGPDRIESRSVEELNPTPDLLPPNHHHHHSAAL